MSEYINIDIALNNLDSNKYGVKLNQEEVKDRFEEVYSYLDNQPTVDVVQVVHAHWIVKGDDDMDNEMYHCSNCGEEQFFSNYYGEEQEKFPYCPMCGAKMDEKVD